MQSDWEIKPRVGLGKLNFGMTRADVATFEEIYGSVEGTFDTKQLTASFDETAKLFGEFFSADDIAAVRDVVEKKEAEDHQVETLDTSGLVLDYHNGRLVSVVVSERNAEVHLGGQPLFRLNPREALVVLEKANGRAGRYQATGAVFDGLAITCDGLSIVTDERTVEPLEDPSEHVETRTVTVAASPNPPDGAGSDIVHSFVSPG